MKPIGVAILTAVLTGCAGIGSEYDTPAEPNQIPFSVTAITPAVTESMAITRPTAKAAPENSPSRSDYQYRIGTADVLAIFVDVPLFAEDASTALSTGQAQQEARLYTVSERGEIFLPLHGPLPVAGLTITEAYEAILVALKEFFARPQINVSVAEFRSQRVAVVFGSGEGSYIPITNQPLSILDAVMQTPRESLQPDQLDFRNVVLKRDGHETGVDLTSLIESSSFGSDWLLKDRDVVLVPKNSNGVYLIGEIPNQRRLIDPYGTSLAELLFPQPVSPQQRINQIQQLRLNDNFLNLGSTNIGSIFVIRGDTTFAHVYHLNAKTPDALLLADEFPMLPGDVVFVSTRRITRFNRFIAEILPSLAPALLASQFTD